MLHIRLAAIALMAIALAGSGCGGSTKSSSHARPSTQPESSVQTESTAQKGPLTRAELIARANAICRRITAKLNSSPLRSRQDFARIAAQVASFEQAALAELNKLIPPASLAGDWRQVLASIRMLADNTRKAAEDVTKLHGNRFNKTIQALISANYNTRRPLLATAARAGFSDCAQVL